MEQFLQLGIYVSSLCFFRPERRGNHSEKMNLIISSRLLSTTFQSRKLNSSWKLQQHNFHINRTIREGEVIWKDSRLS